MLLMGASPLPVSVNLSMLTSLSRFLVTHEGGSCSLLSQSILKSQYLYLDPESYFIYCQAPDKLTVGTFKIGEWKFSDVI